jgi:hypothetical protein
MLKIDSAVPSGGQGKLTYFMYFNWLPLEAGLSFSTFVLYVIHTAHILIINTSTNLRTQQNTFRNKYKNPTCFGTGVP